MEYGRNIYVVINKLTNVLLLPVLDGCWRGLWPGGAGSARRTVPALTPAGTGSPCKMVCPEAEIR